MKAGTAFFSRQNEEIEYLLERNIENVASTRGLYRFYGLVDTAFNTVNVAGSYQDGVDRGYLSLINSETNPIFVTKFVHDAFEAMTTYYNIAKNNNIINATPATLVNLNIRKGYQSIKNTHESYMQTYFEAFNSFMISRGLIEKMTNFKSFMVHFEDFLHQTAQEAPLTRTGFTRSLYSNVLNGGLAIELENISKSNESSKVQDFYENPNFDSFSKIAIHFGFVIDRDVPWRLIANVSSPRMKLFMEQYKLSRDNLFEEQYVRTSLLDMSLLIKHATTFYNTYVSRQPRSINPEIVFDEKCNKTRVKIRTSERGSIDGINAINQYGAKNWIKLYFKLRLAEEKISMTEAKTNSLLKSVFARSKKNNSIDLSLASIYSDIEIKRRINIEI